MSNLRQNAELRAKEYMRTDSLMKELGSGAEGFVFPTADTTAVKVFTYPEKYETELAAYARLHVRKIDQILGFAIPRLLRCHSKLLIIEMTIVQPPFLLDFAQATIDHPFPFAEGQEEDYWDRVRLAFDDRFEIARDVFYALFAASGVYYYDLAPRNMNFGDA